MDPDKPEQPTVSLEKSATNVAHQMDELAERAEVFRRAFEQQLKSSGLRQEIHTARLRATIAVGTAFVAILGLLIATVALNEINSEKAEEDRQTVEMDRKLCETGNERSRSIREVLEVFERQSQMTNVSIPGISAEQMALLREEQARRFREAKDRLPIVDCTLFVPAANLAPN